METNPEPGGSAVGADEAVEAQHEDADASAPTGPKKRKDQPRADTIADYAAVMALCRRQLPSGRSVAF
jgi:hypothetical protein